MIKRYYSIVKQFFSLRACKPSLLFHLFFSALLRSLSLLTIPLVASKIIDVASTGNYQLTIKMVLAYILCAIMYVMLHHYNFEAYAQNSIYTHNKLQELMLDKVTTFDENFTKEISVPFIVNTSYNDVGSAMQVPDNLFDAITSLINIIIAIIILFRVDIIVGFFTFIVFIISMICLDYNMQRRNDELAKQRISQDEVSGIMGQVIDGTKEIKAFNMESDIESLLEENKNKWREHYFKKRVYQDRVQFSIPELFGFGKSVVYLVLIILIFNQKYSVATLVLVIGYYGNIQTQLIKLFKTLEAISGKAIRVERIHKILNYKNKNMIEYGDNNTDDIKGHIQFKDVYFNYEKQASLTNINFTIEPNTFTAIVGKSGSGKSTIFRLLLRLYRVNKGCILLDNINIYDYSKEVYASNVSIVTQKPFIFDMSIRENFNLVDSNHEHQIEACKICGIHDFIMSLKDGYNTKMVKDAENISTGQKQLIALARTLLSKSEVLLFDEVTSSLDVETSEQVVKIFQNLRKNHTVLMITHKPELMAIADDIIVIDKGKMVGRGKHSDLIKSCPEYQILHKK